MAGCHLAFVLCLLIHSLLFGEYQQALGRGLEIWRLQHLWVSVLGVRTKLCAEVPFVQCCIKPLYKDSSLLSHVRKSLGKHQVSFIQNVRNFLGSGESIILLAGVPGVGGIS